MSLPRLRVLLNGRDEQDIVSARRRYGVNRLGPDRIRIALSIVAIVLSTQFHACTQPEEISAIYFYQVPCSTCAELTPAQLIAGRLGTVAREHDHISVVFHDIERPSGRAAFDRVASKYGLSYRNVKLPILIANDRVFQGEMAVGEYADRIGK